MINTLLDLCVRFAHKIEEQEETINELREETINELREEIKRKTGHWIPVEKGFCYECSNCHKIFYPKFAYCPICGSRMEDVKPIV